jgi:hypothetical protein
MPCCVHCARECAVRRLGGKEVSLLLPLLTLPRRPVSTPGCAFPSVLGDCKQALGMMIASQHCKVTARPAWAHV